MYGVMNFEKKYWAIQMKGLKNERTHWAKEIKDLLNGVINFFLNIEQNKWKVLWALKMKGQIEQSEWKDFWGVKNERTY